MTNLALCGIASILVGLLAPSLSERAEPARLYVATDGNDAWTGELSAPNAAGTDGPFASLARAREEIRARRATSTWGDDGVDVILREGTYELAEPFLLSIVDSGRDDGRGSPGWEAA